MTSPTAKFQIRKKAEIVRLLKYKETNNYTVAAFCTQHGISHQTFYNWEKKYGAHRSSGNDFIALPGMHSADANTIPFCEVLLGTRTTIRFFEAVDSKYLKSLIS